MKDITVQEFINTYNKKESDQEKHDYIKSMVKIEYMPINTKMTLAEKIIENAYWKDVEKKDIVNVSSPVRHVLHVYTIINNYTYIHMDNKTMAEDYDYLNRDGLVVELIKAIGNDVAEFTAIEEMTAQDFMTNHYGTQAFIQNQVTRVNDVLKQVVTSLAPVFAEAMKDISKEDIIKLVKAISSK